MFLFIPVDGWPQVIDADPTDQRISDLMGAIPFPTSISDDIAAMVCEDQAGQPLNIGASYLVSLIYRNSVPVTGPVCLLGIGGEHAFTVHDSQGLKAVVGADVSLPADDAQALARGVEDALYADRGADGRVQPGGPHNEYNPYFRAVGIRASLADIRASHEAASQLLPDDDSGIGSVYII